MHHSADQADLTRHGPPGGAFAGGVVLTGGAKGVGAGMEEGTGAAGVAGVTGGAAGAAGAGAAGV
jgi:hypothetical protein